MSITHKLQNRPILLRWFFLVFFSALAIFLRFDAHKNTYYVDEEIPIAVIKHMEAHKTLDTNWANAAWGNYYLHSMLGYDQYNFSSYNSTLFYLNQIVQSIAPDFNRAFFNRATSVAFQIITLGILFFVMDYFIGLRAAMAGSLFFVVNPLLVVDAHYARPESFLMLVVTLAITGHLLAIKQGKHRYFAGSALLWGIAAACKFSLLPMAGLAFLHLLFLKPSIKHRILFPLLFLLGAFLLAPYMFINAGKVLNGIQALFAQYFNTDSVNNLAFERSDLLLPRYLIGYFGIPFWLAIFFSLSHPDHFLKCTARWLLVICFFYITIFSLLSFFNESNLSHLAFAWCLLLGIAIDSCILHAQQRHYHVKSVFPVILIIVLAIPFICSLKIRTQVYDSSAEEKQKTVIAGFEKNLLAQHPNDKIIALQDLQIPIHSIEDQSIILKTHWINRNEYFAIERAHVAGRFILLAELTLPLGDLPHSQLQSIHFPASYRYYQLNK